MKTKDCSKAKNENCQLEDKEKLMSRREVLNKAGLYALSTATMMVLLKSQAKAGTSGTSRPAPNVYIAPSSGSTEKWQRTKRS